MRDRNTSGDEVPGTETDSAILAGVTIAAADANPEDQTFVMVPRNCELQSLEEYRSAPRRIQRTVCPADVESFIVYVNTFKTDATIICTDAKFRLAIARTGAAPEITFTAHLNYHKPGAPSWDEHLVELKLIRSREWLTWTAANKRPWTQAQLCEFVEENMPDIIEPDSARLLEVIRQFEVKKEIRFNSAKNLTSGDVQFLYEETSTGTSQKGTIEMPETLTIGVRVFEGMDAYKVPVKLRWKLAEQKLTLWLDMIRFHRFERDALDSIVKQVRQGIAAPLYQVSTDED